MTCVLNFVSRIKREIEYLTNVLLIKVPFLVNCRVMVISVMCELWM